MSYYPFTKREKCLTGYYDKLYSFITIAMTFKMYIQLLIRLQQIYIYNKVNVFVSMWVKCSAGG